VIGLDPDEFDLVPEGSTPAGAVLAITYPDGTLVLHALPRGTDHGPIPVDEAPQGARNVVAHIERGWHWRLLSGEGYAPRQGKGPPRGDGTRPKLAILDPCRSVSLRAVAISEEFHETTLHVTIVWVQILRTSKWAVEYAHAWATGPDVAPGNRTIDPAHLGVSLGLTACSVLLACPPSLTALEVAVIDHRAAVDDADADVST
jgi:hypothetical protein